MPEAKTYSGGCHCGAVRYEATLDMAQVIECNCSHCAKKGFILTFTSAPGFTLMQGEDQLMSYQFNKKMINHLFCKVCGTQSFARGKTPDGKDMAAVNVRCLDDFDLASITPTPVNGKDF